MAGTDGTAYLNAKEAAKILGVSDTTVRRAIAAGTIPALQLGRKYRIHRDDIERARERGRARVHDGETVEGLLSDAAQKISRALAKIEGENG